MEYDFKLDFAVRDYECDMDGVVNNAVYHQYFEHTRNECLKTIGLDYAEMTKQNQHLFVARITIEYRYPLRSGDRFFVGLKVVRNSNVKLDIQQDIYRVPDNRVIANATMIVVGLDESGSYRLPKKIIDYFPVSNNQIFTNP